MMKKLCRSSHIEWIRLDSEALRYCNRELVVQAEIVGDYILLEVANRYEDMFINPLAELFGEDEDEDEDGDGDED